MDRRSFVGMREEDIGATVMWRIPEESDKIVREDERFSNMQTCTDEDLMHIMYSRAVRSPSGRELGIEHRIRAIPYHPKFLTDGAITGTPVFMEHCRSDTEHTDDGHTKADTFLLYPHGKESVWAFHRWLARQGCFVNVRKLFFRDPNHAKLMPKEYQDTERWWKSQTTNRERIGSKRGIRAAPVTTSGWKNDVDMSLSSSHMSARQSTNNKTKAPPRSFSVGVELKNPVQSYAKLDKPSRDHFRKKRHSKQEMVKEALKRFGVEKLAQSNKENRRKARINNRVLRDRASSQKIDAADEDRASNPDVDRTDDEDDANIMNDEVTMGPALDVEDPKLETEDPEIDEESDGDEGSTHSEEEENDGEP